MQRPTLAAVITAIALLSPCTVPAHDLSLRECQEARDFVRNAALSRDGGLSREEFLTRFSDDIELIQKFPPDLRWFVQDGDDERLLRAAVEQVFDAPDEPERHGELFLNTCYGTIAHLTPR